MISDSKTFLKITWTLASVSCFLFPLFVTPFYQEDYGQGWLRRVTAEMLFGMLVLTFPLGVFYLIAILILASTFMPRELPISSYVLMWFGFVVIGYMQWFHLLPSLLDRRNKTNNQSLTTLGLERSSESGARKKRRRRTRARRHVNVPAELEARNILEFDISRHSPLERVISDR
jgi:hypothetical protein